MNTNRKLTIVANLPVSMECNMRLFADGPYDRTGVERFVKQLQLQIDLGAFDSSPPQQSSESK